jgi:hypothetical protein
MKRRYLDKKIRRYLDSTLNHILTNLKSHSAILEIKAMLKNSVENHICHL